MNEIHPLHRGLAPAFLALSLTACAGKPTKPEVVEVAVPVYVRLPSELTSPVTEPQLPVGAVTNADLADWADALRAALGEANARLRRIEALQPREKQAPEKR